LDFFLIRRGWDWTLVELNKAASLAGLTVFLTAFLPPLAPFKRDILWVSLLMLWPHSAYSFYKFYSFSPRRLLNDKPIKQLSVVLGSAGQAVIAAGYYGLLSAQVLLWGGVILSLAHFWTMEVDYKYVLQVRPFAYLPFLLGAVVVVKQLGFF
jgi:hypothetical protein